MLLGDVRPFPLRSNVFDCGCRARQIEAFNDLPRGYVAVLKLDKPNLALIKLRARTALAKRRAALINHINGIVLTCANKQVRRIYTWPIVTFMKNTKLFRNVAVMQHPGNSVAVPHDWPHAQTSVTLAGGTLPFPAIVRAAYLNLFPEMLDLCVTEHGNYYKPQLDYWKG